MHKKEIHTLFDQLDACIQQRELSAARSLSLTLFTILLKSLYSQIRGQVSASVMRGLLDLEIEIGGENGDFREYNHHQMIDLINRVSVAGHMQAFFVAGTSLSAAVDLSVIADWFGADGSHVEETPSLATVQFVYRWLALFAEEAGIIDLAEAGAATPHVDTISTSPSVTELLRSGAPYIDSVTGMTFVLVPGGTFSMGDTANEGVEDERPVHEVTLSPFYMAIYPVTQAQWTCLMPKNPSLFIGDKHPVEQVALVDVMTFIEKMNDALPGGMRLDLPSEAQWEYAARSGGRDELIAGGADPETVAWFEANSAGGTAPVGGKSPNELGLYDMSGNVWEYCRDHYHPEAYRRHRKIDPVCTTGNRDRVIRGGSWNLDAWSLRCSRRFRFDPELFGPALGFRLVMVLPTFPAV